MVEQLAQEYQGKLKIVGADIASAYETASGYGIMGIPALLFFKDGKEVHRIVGAPPKEKLQAEIKERLGV